MKKQHIYYMLRYPDYDSLLSLPRQWTAASWLCMVVAYYAAVTITPSIPVGDPVIRSSWAMLIFGDNTAADLRFALVAVCIWAINILIPMLFNIKVIKNLHN